jgi:hypothetical protein
MSEKIEKDETTKKKLNLTKEVIEELKDEDLEKVAGGDGRFAPGSGPGFTVSNP